MEPEDEYMGEERRGVERHRVNLRARWKGRHAGREGSVTDLSTAGCFVLSNDLFVEKGDPVHVELVLPAGVITLPGRVIYTAEEIGFGVRFSPFYPEDERRKLELLISAEARRSRMKSNR
jgi:hypothetical protein